MRQVSIHSVPVIIPHLPWKWIQEKPLIQSNPASPPPTHPNIVFSCQKKGWMNNDVSFEWVDHVSVEIYARKKVLLVLGGHRSHTQPCCNWTCMNIWTVLMLLPLTALIKCSLLILQTSDPLTHNIHGFFYHGKIYSTAWTVNDKRTYHIIGGYAIPMGCNTKTVMNRLKKS